jgi:amidase
MSGSVEYSTASALVARLESGELGSRDLLERYLARIAASNPSVNAVVAMDPASARQRADAADAARLRGECWGPLHGLPMTIKDTWEVAGMPCTAGSVRLKDHVPKRHAVTVQRLIDAGAIIFGKTNVPEFATDLQSYNKVYGTTSNPWDTARTPGGSSGGAAAAVAAGFTACELGSDIGGSIRTPAHYCGVFGHKVSHGVISMRGHIPGPPGTVSEPDLAVGGPLARCAGDLALLLGVVAGPDPSRSAGWRLDLPPSRLQSLKGSRVLAWFDDPLCPLDQDMRAGFREVTEGLRREGAIVTEGGPAGLGIADFHGLYLNLLASVLGTAYGSRERSLMYWSSSVYERLGKRWPLPRLMENFFRGAGQSHADWLRHNERRNRLREKVTDAFRDYDVILAPVVPMVAIPHQQKPELPFRKITINGESRHYSEHLPWISLATLLGLPATAAPVARNREGLPYGLQIIGAPFEDYTTIRFAGLLESLTGGFHRPPAFA